MTPARRTVFLASVACDLAGGEPPVRVHPVVYMGKVLAAIRRVSGRRPPTSVFAIGSCGLLAGVWLSWLLGRRAERAALALPPALGGAARGWVLKSAYSVRTLFAAVSGVQSALARGELERARRALGRNLVSRPTASLSRSEVAAAAIESLAENLSDSVVAPWLAHRLAGLPAAMAYRFVNTADAMLGYRTPELEWIGKPAAKLDDVLNLAPARLTAGLIALSAPAGGGRIARAWLVARRDHGLTASPNAGWPMAAMAGALDRSLSKRGAYRLNQSAPTPSVEDICRALRVAAVAAVLAGVILG